MACRSMINTRLSSNTLIAAGGTIPVGPAVHGFGRAITSTGSGITLAGCGRAYYRIIAHCTVVPTADAEISVQVLDGSTVLDQAEALPAAAGGSVDLSLIATVYNPGCGSGAHNISFVLGAAGTVQDLAVEVEQI